MLAAGPSRTFQARALESGARALAAGFLMIALGCAGESGQPGGGDAVSPGPAAPAGMQAVRKGEGVRRMAERLEGITRSLDPKKNIFVNTERVAMLKTGLAENPGSRLEILPRLAEELLKAGNSEEAIA